MGTTFTVAVFTIFATSNVDSIVGIPHKKYSMQRILIHIKTYLFVECAHLHPGYAANLVARSRYYHCQWTVLKWSNLVIHLGHIKLNGVWCHYNMVKLFPNMHNRYPIARLREVDKGCLLWVHIWSVLYISHCSHFTNDIFKCIFLNEKNRIFIKI